MSSNEPLLKASGEPMKDQRGNELRVGQRAVDDLFDMGTVQGTCPVEGLNEGLNVQVQWDAPRASDGDEKPTSRGAQHLMGLTTGGGGGRVCV